MSAFEQSPVLSGFDPAVATWFARSLGEPTPPQAAAWPLIRDGRHVLIAAPTGSGKTLAAFLAVIDALVAQGRRGPLPDQTTVLYVSPLKALSNDIRKNLDGPLNGIADALLEAGLPPVEIRAMVRTGDTPQADRAKMRRQPPHILVTTPESLFILLGSESGRQMLADVRHVIVDEIHALVDNKRGAHLSLSLARLQALCDRPLQRIGLSATQKPIEAVARFLCGDEACQIVDSGHGKDRDLALEVPDSPLTAVMAGEVWGEVYDRLAALAREHRTTLVFTNTRRLTERLARHLGERLGEEAVAAHHGSMSKEHRLRAEQRLKAGELRLLVATASLELGIDIGEVDLVCQIGSPRRISAFLQRVGRSGHTVGGTPKGRLFPTSLDEAVECAALLAAVAEGELDALQLAGPALDVLAQQLVAEVASREWSQQALLQMLRQAWPYRTLGQADYEAVLGMLADGYSSRRGRRGAYLHWDRINGTLRARRGAQLVALTNAGVIPDQFDYDVILMPEGIKVGSLNEDFAFETLVGDIFQLGNQSYRVQRNESGRLLVEDASGQPPTLPFWFGEAPGRSDELSAAVSRLRQELALRASDNRDEAVDWLAQSYALGRAAASQIVDYLSAGQLALGVMPGQRDIVLERFFDDTGDMHLVVHSCYGSRINKAWGLALRKRFCRKFNFELQAAALEDSIVLSLGITHSFPLDEVAGYLKAATVKQVLEQALLDAPMFPTHWRWNASTALAIRRHLGSRKTPPAWQRNDAEDLLAVVFPDQIACAENLDGPRQIPEHPLVKQTMHDCLHGLMDLDGLIALLDGLESGHVRLHCAELNAPSPLAQEILNARPYAFLDDGDAENRRTMAVSSPPLRSLDDARSLRQLEPQAIVQVRAEAWPTLRDADELHDALMIHGFFCAHELSVQDAMLGALQAQGRCVSIDLPDAAIWVAMERVRTVLAAQSQARCASVLPDNLPPALDEPLRELVRGRLELLGPTSAQALAQSLGLAPSTIGIELAALEQEGFVVRGRFEGEDEQWCERRLLARIHRYSRDSKRARVRPVAPLVYQRFMLRWHGLDGERPEGVEALLGAMEKLEGYCAPAASWERDLLPARLSLYMPSQLDAVCAAGKLAWARLSPGRKGAGPVRQTPVAFVPREHLPLWRQLLSSPDAEPELSHDAELLRGILATRGAMFFSDLQQASGLLRAQLEAALGQLVAGGLVSADSFAGLRGLITPATRKPRSAPRTRRHRPLFGSVQDAGRWFLLPACVDSSSRDEALEHYLWSVLARYGVISRAILERDGWRPPWRDLLPLAWRLEARGEILGGRFVDSLQGEQFALPEAVELLRTMAGEAPDNRLLRLSAVDPAHLSGSILPGERPGQSGPVRAVVYHGGRPCAWMIGKVPELAKGLDQPGQAQCLAMLTGANPGRRGLRA